MRSAYLLTLGVGFLALQAAQAHAADGYYFRKGQGDGGADKPLAMSVNAPPSALSAGESTAGAFKATGGTPPYSYAKAGSYPAGVDLNPDGTLTGAFPQAGTYTIGATVTDAGKRSATLSMDVEVRPAAPVIALSAPANAVAGAPFSASASQVQGGAIAYGLPVQPGWLTVSADGWIGGIVPVTAQAFAFDVLGTDAFGRSDRRSSGSVAVVQPAATLSGLPPRIVEGDAISGILATNLPGAIWSKISGPSWLSVSPGGMVSGQGGDVPPGPDATASFSARASLGAAMADVSGSVAIAPATVTFAGGQVRAGLPFSLPVTSTMAAAGTFAATASPNDISGLAVSGGNVSGTAPSVTQASSRSITVTKTASAGGASAVGTGAITVNPRLSFTTQPQNVSGSVGTQVSATRPVLAGALSPTRFSLLQNTTDITASFSTTCAGLSFDAQTGLVSGNPTATCSMANLSVSATDAGGTSNSDTAKSNSFTISIQPQVCVVDINNNNSYKYNQATYIPAENSIIFTFDTPKTVNRIKLAYSLGNNSYANMTLDKVNQPNIDWTRAEILKYSAYGPATSFSVDKTGVAQTSKYFILTMYGGAAGAASHYLNRVALYYDDQLVCGN